MAEVTGGGGLQKVLGQFAANASKATTVDVGFLPKATYPDGTNVAMVAAVQDFGSPKLGIPPRPFFRNMIAQKKGEWSEAIAKNFKANNYDAEKTLEQVGAAVAGQLRQSIVDTNSPPLAPVTIARKGFDKPLIDTSNMINSVDFQVNKE